MRLKKIILMFTLLILPLTLVGCIKDDGLIEVGILQFMEAPALTAARQGFIDGLAKEGYIEGENIKFNILNPQGLQNEMQTMSRQLVRNSDLIFAIATPAASSVVQVSKELRSNKPILFTAVTDPVASKLISSNDFPGGNVTGTNDMNPVVEQIALAKQLLPDAKKIGILYNSNEDNSEIQAKIAIKAAKDEGLIVEEKTFSSISDIQTVAGSLANSVDIIYTPTDNMVADSIELLNDISKNYKTPFIVGEDTLVPYISSLTIGISYYNLGLKTAEMAIKILRDDVKPSEIPSTGLTDLKLVINNKFLSNIGIIVPEDLLNKANEVIN